MGRIMLCLLITLIACAPVPASQSEAKKQNQKSVRDESPDVIQWKYLLATLATEARSLLKEKDRPYALAAVADAYWNLDRETARALFMAALDSACSPRDGEKCDSLAVHHVLAIATKRDVALTRTLLKAIAEKQKPGDLEDTPLSVALDVLETDPNGAAKLAEAFVPNGLSSGAANTLIFRLARQDIVLANQVYGGYLNKFATDSKLPLSQLISFAGYAFGYSEFYGLTQGAPPQLYGVSSRPISNLSLNPALVKLFLDLTFQRISESVERAAQMVGAEREHLTTINLFAIAYLLPEVGKYYPNALPAWERLQQRAMIGTTAIQLEQVGQQVQSINERRARAQRFDDAPQLSAEQEAEAMIERAEKLSNSCQRDKEYSKASLILGSSKQTKRALAIADRISDLKQRDGVMQFLFHEMAVAARDAGEWTEMREKSKSISTPEVVAVLYIKAADVVHLKDGITSAELISEALKNAERISDPGVRAGVLLGAAAVQVKMDVFPGLEVLKTAIKTVNQGTAKGQNGFSFLMKVSLACPGDDEWYGARISLANSTLYEVLPLFAAHNVEETLLIARSLEDASTKIQALASVVKYMTDEKRSRPKSKLPVANVGAKEIQP
ncbi:MAG TPA: hypothetical protein VN844_06030 [Pyrinomonadaceae bacterium]|nr:hypothetical protein [Pyrinomonadaceae bacterium]